MFDLDAALRYLIVNEGSDLHLKVPARPIVRLNGGMEPIEGTEPLMREDTERVFAQMLGDDPKRQQEWDTEGECDFSYSVVGLGRFRVSAFRQRGSVSLVLRAIPVLIKSVADLELPPVITELAESERGIILLTGTTGSGKSTTLAAMIDHINATMKKHIVTIEDPIEFLHRDKTSIINQREVGQDTGSFSKALRRVLRQDPDVILVGEMRDEETVRTALSAAETGHLVLSTLHTVDATEAVNRIIDFFPPHQQNQARAMIAGTLRGVVSQRLVKRQDGLGRVATCEVLVKTGRVQDLILDASQTHGIHEVIAEGAYYGMQTFDQALLGHLRAGRISMEAALNAATSPHDFKLVVAAEMRAGGGDTAPNGTGANPAPSGGVSPAPMVADVQGGRPSRPPSGPAQAQAARPSAFGAVPARPQAPMPGGPGPSAGPPGR